MSDDVTLFEHLNSELEGQLLQCLNESAELAHLLQKARELVTELEKKHAQSKSILMHENLQLRMKIARLRQELAKSSK